MVRSTVLLTLLVLLAGCSTHFSTLQPEGSKEQIIYALPEEQAFQIAHGSLAVTLPGRKIEVIDGPVRGYSTYFRFVLDTYTQQVLVHAAQGTDALGKKVRGYYFEVSGSGSSFVQGRAKNVELFERLAETAKATGKGIAVTSTERIGYANAKWRVGESELEKNSTPATSGTNKDDVLNSLERLKGLRDRGVITEEEFEAKKKELLNRL
jgi:secreted protein with Ig-like and vWFA domain